MTSILISSTKLAPQAIGPYSQATCAGDLVFCSGQLGLDPVSGALVAGGIVTQTERALDNLAAVLASNGSAYSDVLRATVYLTDLNDFADMNAVYAERFGDHRPARVCIEVGALPLGAVVEIDCIAVRGVGRPGDGGA